MKNMSGFWNGLGFALVIFALCIGIGKCTDYFDKNSVLKEQEKTKQLELKLQLQREGNRLEKK